MFFRVLGGFVKDVKEANPLAQNKSWQAKSTRVESILLKSVVLIVAIQSMMVTICFPPPSLNTLSKRSKSGKSGPKQSETGHCVRIGPIGKVVEPHSKPANQSSGTIRPRNHSHKPWDFSFCVLRFWVHDSLLLLTLKAVDLQVPLNPLFGKWHCLSFH